MLKAHVGKDSTLLDGDVSEKLVELLVVAVDAEGDAISARRAVEADSEAHRMASCKCLGLIRCFLLSL